MIGMLSISFGIVGTLPLASLFLGGVWVVSVQPVVAGPLVPRPKELTVCSLSFAVFFHQVSVLITMLKWEFPTHLSFLVSFIIYWDISPISRSSILCNPFVNPWDWTCDLDSCSEHLCLSIYLQAFCQHFSLVLSNFQDLWLGRPWTHFELSFL